MDNHYAITTVEDLFGDLLRESASLDLGASASRGETLPVDDEGGCARRSLETVEPTAAPATIAGMDLASPPRSTTDATALACPDLSESDAEVRLKDLFAALGRADRLASDADIKTWAAVGADGSARATVAWLLLGKAAVEYTDPCGGIEKANEKVRTIIGRSRAHVQQARDAWEYVVQRHDGVLPHAWLSMSQNAISRVVDAAKPSLKSKGGKKRSLERRILAYVDKVGANEEVLLRVLAAYREREAGRTPGVAAVTGDAAALMAVVQGGVEEVTPVELELTVTNETTKGPPRVDAPPVIEVAYEFPGGVDEDTSLTVVDHRAAARSASTALSIGHRNEDFCSIIRETGASLATRPPFPGLTTDVRALPVTVRTMIHVALSSGDIKERPPLFVAPEAYLADRLTESLSLDWSSNDMGFQRTLSRADIVRVSAAEGAKVIERLYREIGDGGSVVAKKGVIVTGIDRCTPRQRQRIRENILDPHRLVPLLFTANTCRGIDADFLDACRVIEVETFQREELVTWLHAYMAPYGASRAEVAAILDHHGGRIQPAMQTCNDLGRVMSAKSTMAARQLEG
jgi:hypothetical protein